MWSTRPEALRSRRPSFNGTATAMNGRTSLNRPWAETSAWVPGKRSINYMCSAITSAGSSPTESFRDTSTKPRPMRWRGTESPIAEPTIQKSLIFWVTYRWKYPARQARRGSRRSFLSVARVLPAFEILECREHPHQVVMIVRYTRGFFLGGVREKANTHICAGGGGDCSNARVILTARRSAALRRSAFHTRCTESTPRRPTPAPDQPEPHSEPRSDTQSEPNSTPDADRGRGTERSARAR